MYIYTQNYFLLKRKKKSLNIFTSADIPITRVSPSAVYYVRESHCGARVPRIGRVTTTTKTSDTRWCGGWCTRMIRSRFLWASSLARCCCSKCTASDLVAILRDATRSGELTSKGIIARREYKKCSSSSINDDDEARGAEFWHVSQTEFNLVIGGYFAIYISVRQPPVSCLSSYITHYFLVFFFFLLLFP